MSNDFSKYIALKNTGASAELVYSEASHDGLDSVTKIRLIRSLFSLSPGQAKEAALRADGLANSLDEFQERIADQLQP